MNVAHHLITVKHCSGRRPLFFPLPGAPSIHRLLRGADLPLRGFQPIARQIQRFLHELEEATDLLIGNPWGLAQEGSARQRRGVGFRTSGAGNFDGGRPGIPKVAHQQTL